MWRCLRRTTFSRFSRTLTCDRHRQTDTQTRGQVIYRTEHSSRGKNLTIFPCGLSYDINENEELNWERQEAK